MSTIPEIVPFSETISQPGEEGLGVGGEVIAKSEMPEIGHSGETSQPGEEGLGVGGEVIAKSEMPEIGQSGETSQPGEEGLRLGQDVRMSTMPEVGQSDVETSQPVVSGSTSEIRLDEILTAGTKLQSVSEKKSVESVEVRLFEASKDSEWFDAIEEKNCKLLLQLFRSDRRLWVQTGLKGRSVLHVAVMQGCSELVGELHNYEGDLVPCGKNWKTPFEFLWENARDGRLKNASAQDIWLVMEGPCVIPGRQWLPVFDRFDGRSRDDYIQSHVMSRMPVNYSEDREMLSLREAIRSIANEKDFTMDETDVDFNFENVERKELYIHMACSRLRNVHNEEDWRSFGCDAIVEFIIAVLTDLREKNLLQKLFDQKDAQGRTILQIFVQDHGVWYMLRSVFYEMLRNLPADCVNALDKAGRTVLHWAVAHHSDWAVELLFGSGLGRPDLTFQTAYILNITAFHLILLYDHNLPPFYGTSLKDELIKDFTLYCPARRASYGIGEWVPNHPLKWAIQMGRNKFVEQVMEIEEYQELDLPKKNYLLSWAAYSGNVESLQLFLQKDDDFAQLNDVALFNAPPLHHAVKARAIVNASIDSRKFDNFLHCNDFISIELLEKKLREKDLEEDSAIAYIDKTKYGVPNINRNQYSARQACANLLLQAGADILAPDKDGHMADPGARAPNEARIWWYELVAKETLNMKKDLNAAGTRTAVVATLVATASFVGPLQPPLSYVAMSSGTATVDVGVQITELLMKVFLEQ